MDAPGAQSPEENRETQTADIVGALRRYGIDIDEAAAGELISPVVNLLNSYGEFSGGGSSTDRRTPAGEIRAWEPFSGPNELGAWRIRTDISGSSSGPLAGARVIVKDSIPIAGVPMANGSEALHDYVPEADAEVITRVLRSGARIVGTGTSEAFCVSGGSHTSWPGAVFNPLDPSRVSGGSSSGCAVAVAVGEADIGVGTDQGGSVRVPSAWCGIYGLKPTFDAIPYDGIPSVETTIDHVGLLTRSVGELRDAFYALADAPVEIGGRGGLGSPGGPGSQEEPSRMARGPLRIGVVAESFQDADDAITASIHQLMERVPSSQAEFLPVSIPLHRRSNNARNVIMTSGASHQFLHRSQSFGCRRPFDEQYSLALERAFAERHGHLPFTLLAILAAGALSADANELAYGRARNRVRELAAAYDAALTGCDVLLLPTVLSLPPAMPEAGDRGPHSLAPISRTTGRNTAIFNATGHPAGSAPVSVGDLSAGAMFVGLRGGDDLVLRGMELFESASSSRTDAKAC